jgi:N-acetyl-gamma-glutamyl-phosphate reductase
MTIAVGIYGATGYTGQELTRLLAGHPEVEIRFVTSERAEGASLRTVAAGMRGLPDLPLVPASEAPIRDADCVLLCLPHTRSAEAAARAVEAGVRVVDLSADLRLCDPGVYRRWYGTEHAAPHLLPVPYGLPELEREPLRGAPTVAAPGCYATAVLLALAPLVASGAVAGGAPVFVDAKSGVSGAGRTPQLTAMFCEVHGNCVPYKIGRRHRHLAEIEQQLAIWGGSLPGLVFVPHLLPTDRGILATIFLPGVDAGRAAEVLRRQYAEEPLVDVLDEDETATLAHVVRTPRAALSVAAAGEHGTVVVSVLDNLLKGAASQALQCFNLMHSLPETLGLESAAVAVPS